MGKAQPILVYVALIIYAALKGIQQFLGFHK